jgi:hypothetical protein
MSFIVSFGTCIYYKFTILDTISSSNYSKIASMNLDGLCISFVVIREYGEGVPISFPLGGDRLAFVSAIHLGLRFQLNIASAYIDKEVFDLVFGDLIYTIGRILVYNGDSKH